MDECWGDFPEEEVDVGGRRFSATVGNSNSRGIPQSSVLSPQCFEGLFAGFDGAGFPPCKMSNFQKMKLHDLFLLGFHCR